MMGQESQIPVHREINGHAIPRLICPEVAWMQMNTSLYTTRRTLVFRRRVHIFYLAGMSRFSFQIGSSGKSFFVSARR